MRSQLKFALLGATVLAGLCAAMPPAAVASPTSLVVGKPDGSKPVGFTVTLPLRNMDKLQDLLLHQQIVSSPLYHQWLTPAEFGLRFGPTTEQMTQAVNALRARGFEVTTHTRSLSVKGSPATVEQAFGTKLVNVRGASGHVSVAASTALRMPAELASIGARAVGLEGIERHTMARSLGKIADGSPDNRFGPNGSYYYTDLKQAYVYPSYTSTVAVGNTTKPFTGVGATIGTVISSDVLDSDVKLIFDHEKFSTTTGTPDPTLFAHKYVNGGAPFSASSNDSFEASLDVQEEITGAPGAHVVIYDINSLADSDIIDGYTAVIDDNILDAVSSSFGECELYYMAAYNGGLDETPTLAYYHELFLQGNAQGITFLASSGDSAGLECISTPYFRGKNGVAVAGVSTPATDSAVTAVGGTNVVTTYDVGTLDSGYSTENAWLDQEVNSDPYGFGGTVRGQVWGAGGGASTMVAAPDYQSAVDTGSTMRTTPDIGMQVGGCPGSASDYNPTLKVCNGGNKTYNGSGNTNRSAVVIAFGGSRYGVIGTSVASPEFTSVMALLIEKYGRMGNANYYIYNLAKRQAAGGRRVYHTMIPGFNGVMQSNVSATYNISTGVGTPIVDTFLGGKLAPPAGLPQTSSNP